jgi:hypothetical protein
MTDVEIQDKPDIHHSQFRHAPLLKVRQPFPRPKKFKAYRFDVAANYHPALGAHMSRGCP